MIGKLSTVGDAVLGPARSAQRVRFGPSDLRRAVNRLTLPRAQRMIRAACGLSGQIEELARSDRSVIHELLGPHVVAVPGMQYPDHLVEDSRTGSGYFFHSHGHSPAHPEERGHFHVFVRGLAARRSHLVAIALDSYGMPTRLFTTNRWVTGENWTPVEALLSGAERFSVTAPDSNALLNRWVTWCVQLFHPQLHWLMVRRDARLRTLAAGRDMERVFEDRRIEIFSECRISIGQQIAALRAALNA